MLVLVCGVMEEPPVAMLLNSLERLGVRYIFIDQKDLVDHISLQWQVVDTCIEGLINIRGESIDIQEITAVFHRLLNLEDISSISRNKKRLQQACAIQRSIIDLFDILPVTMVNPRLPMMSNNSKPLQSLLIRKAGFSIPDTFITNEPEALYRFMENKNLLVYKSMSSVRSIVSIIDKNEIDRINRLQLLPTQFQERIEGSNVRVHVIGQLAVATHIETNAIDYRYPGRVSGFCRFNAMELDPKTTDACIKLAKVCNLCFCGIDLIISNNGTYCLEVNPSPAYSVYQQSTGQPISDILARHLAGDYYSA